MDEQRPVADRGGDRGDAQGQEPSRREEREIEGRARGLSLHVQESESSDYAASDRDSAKSDRGEKFERERTDDNREQSPVQTNPWALKRRHVPSQPAAKPNRRVSNRAVD